MDNNYNPNTNSNAETTGGRSSDSLYSYSYINQREQNQQEQSGQYNSYCNEPGKEGQNRQYYTPYDEPGRKKDKPKKEKKKGGFGVLIGKCAAVALVFGLISGTVFYGIGYAFDYATEEEDIPVISQQTTAPGNSEKLTATSTATNVVVSDVSEVVDNVMPAIVSITNISVQEIQTWFGQTYSQEIPGAGSGIIVAKTEDELYIVTNNHVVADATTLTVSFVDDQSVTAEIKGTDSSTDLAVITVPVSEIPSATMELIKVATLGSSDSLKVGEPAIAIGNAMGYGQSVTTGVISALDREVTVTDYNNNTITNSLIQTDAAINPGNSGGALLNINGEVIGINSVKYTDTDVEGMGYAIPISMADPIINDLITKEVVDESQTAYLGIGGVSVTDEIAETYNIPKGVCITQVMEGSAADKAGLKKGDIITAFDGRTVESWEALTERMQYYAAGTTVDITIKTAHSGEYTETVISVTLGSKN